MPSENFIIADIKQDTTNTGDTNMLEKQLDTITNQPEIIDTVATDTAGKPKETSAEIDIKTDSSFRIKRYDDTEAESVFRRIRERDNQIKQKTLAKQQWIKQPKDTVKLLDDKPLPFVEDTTGYIQGENFIKHITTDIVVIKPAEEADSLTQPQQIAEKKFEKLPYKKEKHSGDWVLGAIIGLLVLFIWVRLFYYRYLSQFARSAFSYLASVNLYRNKNILFHRTAFVLNVIFVFGFGLFIYHVLVYYNIKYPDVPPFTRFLFYAGIVALIYIVKYIVCHIIGFLFLKKELFSEYLHNVLLINKNIGLYLIPVIVVLPYVPQELVKWVIVAGFVIVGLLLLLRLSRSFQIIINKNVFLFYLILYLCIFEILPLLIAYKVLFA